MTSDRFVKKTGGFTLLEIMVALAIIGSLLVTVLYSLNYHLGIAEKHEFVTVATMLARNKMSEMEQIPASRKGSFPDPYASYRYETGIKDSSYPGLSEMWVTVSRDKENVKLTELRENIKK
ncbi:MAG: type II secretion system protein [Nitrospirae bacterium]|nr:type II secretion system protein [Nitrospirota bacterium]